VVWCDVVCQSWGSVMAMFPKGGEALWGDQDGAPEDIDPPEPTVRSWGKILQKLHLTVAVLPLLKL
jgi:hypothetical protein